MVKNDLFQKGFDEGTKIKLLLFKKYIESWLPTFVHTKKLNHIFIYDFFAGEGQDFNGEKGSPLIIMDCLKQNCEKIKDEAKQISITLNDYDTDKFKKLSELTKKFKMDCVGCNNCQFIVKNEAFQDLFKIEYHIIERSYPTFLLIDQYGIKHVPEDIFKKLINARLTDFLFFISSETLRRFKNEKSINKNINAKDMGFDDSKPYECHEKVYEYYKTLIDGDYYLGRFSIKKKANYYGLIFGSRHPLGLEKFLSASWSIDETNGVANHDIDETKKYEGSFMDIFDEVSGISKFKTKLESFEEHLLDLLAVSKTNEEIYKFSLEKGICIPKTMDILKRWEKERIIIVEGSDRKKSGAFYLKHNPEKTINVVKNENNKN